MPQSLAFRQLPWIPWWVPVAVAMLVALAIALLALRGDPPIPVPEVRGQTVENAQALLVDAGLKATPRLQEQVVGDPRQVGRVIAQNPAPGSEIDADGAVILQTGVANQIVGVPNVRGATLEQAQQILGANGLTLGVIDPGDAPRDALVDFQNPAAGDDARLGSPVNVLLAVEERGRGDTDADPDRHADRYGDADARADALVTPARCTFSATALDLGLGRPEQRDAAAVADGACGGRTVRAHDDHAVLARDRERLRLGFGLAPRLSLAPSSTVARVHALVAVEHDRRACRSARPRLTTTRLRRLLKLSPAGLAQRVLDRLGGLAVGCDDLGPGRRMRAGCP